MHPAVVFVVGVVASYLLGAIPFGFLGGRLFGIDVRTVGSGNIGATNFGRALGWGRRGALAFAVVSLLDIGKGFFPALFFPMLAARFQGGGAPAAVYFQLAFGLSAILGHVFPVYLKFRGGKAVNTSLGVLLALAWLPALIAVAAWVIVFAIWRYVSLGSITAAVVFPLALIIDPNYTWGEHRPLFVFCILLAVLIIVRHTGNIKRLLAGTEKRVGRTKG